MSMNNWFWENEDARCENCVVGAYRGVPYLIARDEYPQWSAADPAQVMPGLKVLFSGDDEYTPSPLPDSKYWSNAGTAQELLQGKMDKLLARFDEFKKDCVYYRELSEEAQALITSPAQRTEIVEKYIEECVERKNVAIISRLFKFAEIPHKIDNISFETFDGYTSDMLLFLGDGSEVTPELNKHYPEIVERMVNFGDDNTWGVETIFGSRDGFTDHEAPNLEEKCAIASYVRNIIDHELEKLARQTPQRYKVELPVAENYVNDHKWGEFNDVRFKRTETITVFCGDLMEVRGFTDMYPKDLVKVTERQKTQDPLERR